jgi:hypothetical protein
MKTRAYSLRLVGITLSILIAAMAPGAQASSPYILEVCASGCTYSSVQSAIDDINDSSATKIYTIFVDAGILQSDNSISFNGKDYINLVGRGMGTSVLQASAQWYQIAASGYQNYLDLSDSQNVTLSGITIDARTLDPGGLGSSTYYVGLAVQPPTGTKVTIENCEILGLNYGVSGTTGTGSGLVDVFNSKIRGADIGLWPSNVNWHIFASDLRVMDTGAHSGVSFSTLSAILVNGNGDTTLWGSHVHAESSMDAPSSFSGIGQSGGTITVIGSTVHVKITTANSNSGRRMMAASLSNGTMNLIGTEILYESIPSLGSGRLGGIVFTTISPTVNILGSTFRDGGGSGGTTRADVFTLLGGAMAGLRTAGTKVNSFASGTGGAPVNVAREFDTLGTQKGSTSFSGSGSTVAVVLPVALPDTNYRVAVSANQNQTIWVTSKTTTGFTLNSSIAGSTATVEWMIMR